MWLLIVVMAFGHLIVHVMYIGRSRREAKDPHGSFCLLTAAPRLQQVLGCKGCWASTNLPGEAVTDSFVKPLNHRVADIHLVSHLSNGFAILEEGNDELVGGGGHVYWGGRWCPGALYIFLRCSHMIFKVWSCDLCL